MLIDRDLKMTETVFETSDICFECEDLPDEDVVREDFEERVVNILRSN